jgi:hypothetical protein
MNVISAVSNLVKERDYYREMLSEAQDVIKQLAEGPGEVELIHPLDFSEILQGKPLLDVAKITTPYGEIYDLMKSAKKYKQSILVPRKK